MLLRSETSAGEMNALCGKQNSVYNLHDEIVLVGIRDMIYPWDHGQRRKREKELKRELTGKLGKREWGRGEK